jgi:hypothetical protein
LSNLGEDFCQSLRRSARRIFFHAMMHLDNLQIKTRAENFGRFASQPEKRVHTDAVVWCEDNRDASGGMLNGGDLQIGVARRSDNHDFPMLHRSRQDELRGGMMAEVNDRIGGWNRSGKVVTDVDLRRNFHGRVVSRARDESLPHSSAGAVDEQSQQVSLA